MRNAGESGLPTAPIDAKGRNEVDIPISALPRGPSAHDNVRAAQKMFAIVPAEHRPEHAAAAPAGANVIRRNAIGLPVIQEQDTQPVGRPRVQPLAAPASGTDGLANRRLGGVQLTLPHASPTYPILSRGRIDGSSLTRRGTAPSGLGGPAKPIAGINGTTFRPKQ